MFKTLAANPRTSLAGLLMIATSLTHIIFVVAKHVATETDVMASVTSAVTGLGLFAAGDASKPDKPTTPPTT